MCKDKSITIYNDFYIFDRQTNKVFIIKNEYIEQINCSGTKNAIEKCYNYYHKNRHTLFHSNSIPETTRILTFSEAEKIIEDVFKLIEETHNERVRNKAT